MDPALFYTGIVADLYAPLRSTVPDPDPYARFIGAVGEPALELGCGDGDPLLELRRRGIDVEGVDSSADMLERCRRRAAEQQVEVVVHHQRMEALDLPRRYRTIFLAGPTFNLLPDDAVATSALERIRAHLHDGGGALIPLFEPEPTPAGALGRPREALEPDGSVIRFTAVSQEHDEAGRRQHTVLRYERTSDGDTTAVERTWTLHWYSQTTFRELAAAAGLRTALVLDDTGGVADEGATEYSFWLQPLD